MFDAATYAARRHALMQALDTGLVVLMGNSESPMNYADNVYPFRQDDSFLYYFGIDQPDLAAVIDLDRGETTVYGNELTIDDIVWTGPRPTVAELAASAGVTSTRPLTAFDDLVSRAARSGRPIHLLPQYRHRNILRLRRLLGVDELPTSAPLIRAVVAQRSVKSADEIAEIEIAVDLAVDMHTAGIRCARVGMTEAMVAAEVERAAVAADRRPSFPVIATVRGAVLHNHDHDGVLAEGDLFLIDAGGESPLHYASDLSSTFPVSPRFSDRQRVMYELSLQAHEAALATVGPGVTNLAVHDAAARAIVAGMIDLGLMQGDADEAVAAGAHALFFPCGVGHMMGLGVHDMEELGEDLVGYAEQPRDPRFGYKSLRLARRLEPGFVLTIEPGIYFIGELMDRWRAEGHLADFYRWDAIEAWRDLGGIRNEEDVLVTDDGMRVLGKPKPKTVVEIEELRTR